jgi:hypothetical protein
LDPAPDEIRRIRMLAQQALVSRWKEDLATPFAGHATVEAIRLVLDQWLKRRRGQLTYRLVQVLSGHGCIGKYLHKIARREPTAVCHECGAVEDTPRHTLEKCAA